MQHEKAHRNWLISPFKAGKCKKDEKKAEAIASRQFLQEHDGMIMLFLLETGCGSEFIFHHS